MRYTHLNIMFRSLKLLLVVAFPMLHSCSVFNPEEEIPSYIQIDSFAVKTNYAAEGTAEHNISDAWVFINDEPLGTYELPTTFPVLNKGNVNLKVFAGIKMNGISATRVQYSLMQVYEDDTSFTLFPDSIVKVTPTVKYYSNANFVWMEDFEDTQFSIDTTDKSDVVIERTTQNDEVFQGNGAGRIIIEEDEGYFEGKVDEAFALPKNGFDVYLEMHYKNNIELQVTVNSVTAFGTAVDPMVVLRPTGDDINSAPWNKVYINIKPIIVANPDAIHYEIVFNAIKPDSIGTGEIYIDNLKLAHPQ